MKMIKKTGGRAARFVLLAAAVLTGLLFHASDAEAAVKLRYNDKTHTYTGKQLNVIYKEKKISSNSYKAMNIKGVYMAPYTDIFKKGVKASCSYKKSTGELTIEKNSVKIQMEVGSKSATVDGKSVTLPAAPLSIRYVDSKKTKIAVPIAYVAKALHMKYSKAGEDITLEDPLVLSYDDVTEYYEKARGSIYYNHTNYILQTLPVVTIGASRYMPAEEVASGILKLKYEYNEGTGVIRISNEDTNISLQCQIGSKDVTVNGSAFAFKEPARLIENGATGEKVVCVPLADTMKCLNYDRSWSKKNNYYIIQSKDFFIWEKELSEQQKIDTENNYIYSMKSDYSELDNTGTGSINFTIQGSSADLMKNLTVKRSGQTVTITIPQAKYLLDKNSFSNFGEIVEKIDVVSADDGTVTITINNKSVSDYSYIIQDDKLELNILYTSATDSGNLTDYSLTIPKPENITIKDVTNKDLYESKKFQILIAGNHAEFFMQHPVVINNNSVKNVSVAHSGGNTVITVSTSSLRGYKIYEEGENLVVSMGAPKKIYKSIVVLDAGHGGYDPGAQNKGTNEKDLTLKIIYTLMKDYFSDNAPDIKVYWTRTTDDFVTLADRAAFAKKVDADVFISLHMNSSSNASANGTEVYYSVSNNDSSFGGLTSKKMATFFRKKLVNNLNTKNRGTKSAAYYVLKHNTVPAILIELGFISGNTDYSRLTSSSFQKKAAKYIYKGIVSLFDTYKTGR